MPAPTPAAITSEPMPGRVSSLGGVSVPAEADGSEVDPGVDVLTDGDGDGVVAYCGSPVAAPSTVRSRRIGRTRPEVSSVL